MTKIEENAKFLKAQRARIKKEITALNRVVVDACFQGDVKYDIEMSNGTCSKGVSFRIFNQNSDLLENLDFYNMDYYFNQFTLNKPEIIRSVNKIINTVRKMKKLATKYSKLNQNTKT